MQSMNGMLYLHREFVSARLYIARLFRAGADLNTTNNVKYQVSSFKLVSSFKFQVSSFKFQVSSFKFQVSSFKFQVSQVHAKHERDVVFT